MVLLCRTVFVTLLLAFVVPGGFSAFVRAQSLEKPEKVTDDQDTKYTTVGNIGLTITNFGTIGNRFNYWPTSPSCEYPKGSRIEHVYQGGLWIGAVRNSQIHVSTGASDRVITTAGLIDGYEFTNEKGDTITEYSTLTDNRPGGSTFSPTAVSHQDFVCDYTDIHTRVPSTGDSIAEHVPLGLKVHQESYAWNFPFADFFVILRYKIYNVSTDTLDSVYVGFWNNFVVRNTNLVRPQTPGFFNYTGEGYVDSMRMAYAFDFNGVPGTAPANSYCGLKLLGVTPLPNGVPNQDSLKNQTHYNAWQYRSNDPNADWYASPTDDDNADPRFSRYARMTQSMPQSFIDALRITPRNVTTLLSTGPYSHLVPGDSIEMVLAVICGQKVGSSAASYDSLSQRALLYAHANWAQRAYDGAIVNGQLVRYSLPKPPHQPRVHAIVQNQQVAVYWDKTSAEESVDPVSGLKDFEGYRIYQSRLGEDVFNNSSFRLDMALVGDFDRSNDSTGFNTGFSKVLLDSAKTFPGDTTHYWYRFPPRGADVKLLNGWQYLYGVSSYSSGDTASGIPSLESAMTLVRAIPGTPPADNSSTQIGVYPNPYYVNAYWDGADERLRKLYFYNLPSRCQIKIYTLAGDIVAILDHDASTYNGNGIQWFSTFGLPGTPAQMAGGEHAWDLVTRYDQAIATGLYLFTVEDKQTGTIKRGKFLVIK